MKTAPQLKIRKHAAIKHHPSQEPTMTATIKPIALLAMAITIGQPATATTSSTPAIASACTVKASSPAVALMYCLPQTDEKTWIEAAKSACEPGKSRNVWIWDDLNKMPANAPQTDAELPKSSTSAAVAVWINDSASLMKLKKAR
jgi:hypothetical protein